MTAALPVRDGERFLAEAIESVLAQTRPCDQVIVVDNGSSDASAEIASRYAPAVEVVSEPRPGIGPARNAALDAARGDFLAFLDADDLWVPEKTELQLAAFERDPGLGLVFGHMEQFHTPGIDADLAARLRIPQGPQPGLHVGTAMVSRAAWEAIGPWSEDVKVSDGLAWLLRSRSFGIREEMLPETLARRRVHGENHSLANQGERAEFARVLKRSLDQRRANS